MSQPRYIESQGAWLIFAPNAINCEVLVAGDSQGPDAARLAETEAALRSLETLRNRAAGHLDEFVNRENISPDSDWFLEGFECGLDGHSEGGFVLSFSLEGDTYGNWTVTFRHSSGQYWPVAFGRQAI